MPETNVTHRTFRMPIPFDPREQRVLPEPVPIDYPETEATRQAAKRQQRYDRAECIAEVDDPEGAIDGRLMLDALCDRYGAERVHRWARSACLIRNGGASPCERVERDR